MRLDHPNTRAAIVFAALLSVTGSAIAAEAQDKFALAERIQKKKTEGKTLQIVVGVAGTGIPIQGPAIRIGVEQACKQIVESGLKASCRIVGPVNPNPAQQLAELETLQAAGQVDCLAIQPPLPSQFNNIVNRYAESGVPVFTFNIDTPDAKRIAYYALNEEKAGERNGALTAKLLQQKGVQVSGVAMGSGAPDQPWAQARMKGFVEGFKSVLPNSKFYNEYKSGIPTGKNFTTQEVLNAVTPFLSAHSDINVFFHTDQGIEGVGNVIRNLHLQGKVYSSGFNVSGPILASIDEGITLLTIDQGFDKQASGAVKGCAKVLTGGEVDKNPNQYLDPIVITKDSIDGSLGIGDARKRFASQSR